MYVLLDVCAYSPYDWLKHACITFGIPFPSSCTAKDTGKQERGERTIVRESNKADCLVLRYCTTDT